MKVNIFCCFPDCIGLSRNEQLQCSVVCIFMSQGSLKLTLCHNYITVFIKNSLID